MTIKLKRVELSNIRSHEHVIFTPEDEGITAISGVNGTGKSTIVDSIAWVLYGTKPQGVSKVSAIYRDDAVFGDDRCFAIVEIEVDTQTLKIERRMVNRGGSVECEVWELEKLDDDKENWKQVAGPAVSHSEPYIRKRLRMDEKGFLSAVLVQQKQVDQLISSGPAERAKVIEDLTGISAITEAAREASVEAKSLKRIASLSTIDEDGLEKLKEDKISLDDSLIDQKEIVLDLRDKAIVLKKEGIQLRDSVDEESAKIEASENLKNEMTVVTTKIESHEADLERVTEEKQIKRENLSLLSSGVKLSEIEPKVSKLKKDLRNIELSAAKLESSIKSSNKNLKNFTETIEKSDFNDSDSASLARKASVKDLKNLKEEITDKNNLVLSGATEIKKIKQAISVLTKGDGSCPTCLQHVEDVSAAVGILQNEIDSIETKRSESSEKVSELKETYENLKGSIESIDLVIEAFEGVDELGESVDLEKKELSEFKSQVIVLEGELKGAEKVYNEAKRQEETKREYDRLLKRAQSVSNELEQLTLRKDEITAELKVGGVITSAAMSKLRTKLDDARKKHNELVMKHSEAKGELNLSKERSLHLEEKISTHEKEVKKYKDLLKSVEVASASASLIKEFREERIKNSIPVIEVYASDILSRFTEGKFTRLKIDPKFNTSVCLADGTERAVGLLSGGELSAAALSLRLAISMLLNSGTSRNLIVLDEVLVSQDAGRAELILTTVKDVCKGQVVLIAHNDSIDGIADKVVEL